MQPTGNGTALTGILLIDPSLKARNKKLPNSIRFDYIIRVFIHLRLHPTAGVAGIELLENRLGNPLVVVYLACIFSCPLGSEHMRRCSNYDSTVQPEVYPCRAFTPGHCMAPQPQPAPGKYKNAPMELSMYVCGKLIPRVHQRLAVIVLNHFHSPLPWCRECEGNSKW